MSKWIPLNASMAGNRFNCFDWTLSLERACAPARTSHTTEQHQNFPMQQNVGPSTCSRAEMSDQPSPQASARRVFNRAEGASAASFKAEVQRRRRRWVMLLFTEGESNRGGRLRAGHVHRERGSSAQLFNQPQREEAEDGELRVHPPFIHPSVLRAWASSYSRLVNIGL